MKQKYAGFGVRFVAFLIDGVLLWLGSTAVGYMVEAATGFKGVAVSAISGIVVSIGYLVVYQAKNTQTTGKKMMKIKVITIDGKTPGMITFLLREEVGKLISSLILFIGYLRVLWDPKKQALHDKIAHTYVVYTDDINLKAPVLEPEKTAEVAV